MAKRYELSIKATYLPGWGIYHGCRELIQNAKDAEVQFDAPMTVKFAKRRRNGDETGGILITNEGCTLPIQALLIGHTTKGEDNRLIGKFGEGLKFGVLALLRLGVEVKIRNGSETWVPSIAWSNNYNADVLCFDVSTGNKDVDRVQVEVVGVTEAQWEDVKSKLLFLGKLPQHVECNDGEVITDPRYKGKIFVKGMYVGQRDAAFGFNFRDADIDRDRRMISDAEYKISDLYAQAVNRGHLTDAVFEMLEDGSSDLPSLRWSLTAEAKQSLVDKWVEAHPGATPVHTDEEKQEIEHLGGQGLKVPYTLRQILESKLGTASTEITKRRKSAKKEYSLEELAPTEVENLKMAIGFVARAQHKLGEVDVVSTKNVTVVDFQDDTLLGTYSTAEGSIRIARKELVTRAKVLVTLIHEAAHKHGWDGNKSHEQAIGEITEHILQELLQC
jgi:hypothetical protein